VTSNSAVVIPLKPAVSASSQFSSLPGFMDLTSLQEQLGLLSKPTSANTNQNKSAQSDSNKSNILSQSTASASKTLPTPK